MADIVISYSRKEQEFVHELKATLEQRGQKTWVDSKDTPPTAEWKQEIITAIDGANAFAFVISPNSITSEICLEKLTYAVQHKKQLIEKPLNPANAVADVCLRKGVSNDNSQRM